MSLLRYDERSQHSVGLRREGLYVMGCACGANSFGCCRPGRHKEMTLYSDAALQVVVCPSENEREKEA
jgi:hypothetical protein